MAPSAAFLYSIFKTGLIPGGIGSKTRNDAMFSPFAPWDARYDIGMPHDAEVFIFFGPPVFRAHTFWVTGNGAIVTQEIVNPQWSWYIVSWNPKNNEYSFWYHIDLRDAPAPVFCVGEDVQRYRNWAEGRTDLPEITDPRSWPIWHDESGQTRLSQIDVFECPCCDHWVLKGFVRCPVCWCQFIWRLPTIASEASADTGDVPASEASADTGGVASSEAPADTASGQ